MRSLTSRLARLLVFAPLALLFSLQAHAVSPDQWWDTAYAYRQQLSINSGTSTLASGYSVSISFNHAAEVSAGRSLASGNDVRVVRWTGSAWVELDRIIDPQSSWNSNPSLIWFATSAAIAANTTDYSYYLYYGNTAPAAVEEDPASIFLLYDAFSGSSLNTSLWTGTATPAVGGGLLTLTPGDAIKSNQSFGTDTIWEARTYLTDNLPGGGSKFYYLWLATNNIASGAATGFYIDISDFWAASRASGLTRVDLANPSPATWYTYSFTREGSSQVRFWSGSTLLATITSNITTATLPAFAMNDANGSRETRYDWVRVRRYSTGNPSFNTWGDREHYAVIGQWRMEQTVWNGTADEVQDSGASNLHLASIQSGGSGATTAVTSPAITGNPGTCRYGVFDGTNDYLQRADDAALDLQSRITVAAWVYPRARPASDLKTIVSKDNNYEFHINSSGQIYWWWGGGSRQLTSSTAIPNNQWSHVAITYESGEQHIYINGILRATGASTGNLSTNGLPLHIGQDQNYPGRWWNGYIDEVQIYNRALSTTEVTAVMNAAYPCAASAPPHFVISHDTYGINCAAEQITVDVRDASNNPNTSYNATIQLDTGSGRGTWTRISGSGSFSDATTDDGLATYVWPTGESSATFSLSYTNGAAVLDIDAYQVSDTTIRDDDTEGSLTFSPNGFTVTAAALSNPPPASIPAFASPQTAGTDVSVHIAAYGQTPTDATCGIIEAYTGAKTLKFWSTYANPTSGTRNMTVNGINAAVVEASAAAQAVTFTNGQAVVTAKYKDAGSIALSMKDDSSADPSLSAGIRGSTGNVVFKPANFSVTSLMRTSDSGANPAATSETGAVFIAAGRPMTATITALDAEGSTTPNFGAETPAESVELSTVLVVPAAGANPAITAPGGLTFSSGTTTRTDLYWSEVGIIQLRPHIADGSYLGSGDVIGSLSGNVGRFIPDHFDVSENVPQFQTGCTLGAFTYVGQPLSYSVAPVLTVSAKTYSATAPTITTNYAGTLFKITDSTLTDKQYLEQTTSSIISRGVPSSDPAILPLGGGIATLTFSSGSGLMMTRTAPVAPFSAQIRLSIKIADSDAVKYANAATADQYRIGSAGGIAFTAGNQQRYGRVAFRNAVGSELLPLPLPLRAEYFFNAAAGFVANNEDQCSSLALSKISAAGSLTTSDVCVQDTGNPGASGLGCASAAPLAQRFRQPPMVGTGGSFNLHLGAPGASKRGSVTFGATVPEWLQFNWDNSTPIGVDPMTGATTGMENPTGIATFGIFQGNSNRIYQRETY